MSALSSRIDSLRDLLRPIAGEALAAQLGFCALAGLAVLWAMASFTFGLFWDQGMFTSVGDAIVRGEAPYRDAWDIKGPAAYYLCALVQSIFGRTTWGLHVLDFAFLLPALLMLRQAIARLTTPVVASWAALGLVLWYASLGWKFATQPDGWATMILIVAIAPLLGRDGPPPVRRLLLSGIGIGVATLFKPTYAPLLAVPGIVVLLSSPPVGADQLRRSAVEIVWLSIGWAIPVAVCGVVALAQGWLAALYEVLIDYNRSAYSGVDSLRLTERVGNTLRFFWSTIPPQKYGRVHNGVGIGLAALLMGGAELWRRSPRRAAPVLVWFAICLGTVVLQGRFYSYHWIPLAPPLVVLCAVGLAALHDAGGALPRRFAQLLAAVLLLQLSSTPLEYGYGFLRYATGGWSPELYYGSMGDARFNVWDEQETARYLREHTDEEDTITVWGVNADLHFLSGRRSTSRFVHSMGLASFPGPYQDRYRDEFIAALRANPPTYFVVGIQWSWHATPESSLADFPALKRFVEDGYHEEWRQGSLTLLRRNERRGDAP